jgi:ribosomal protein L7/L12
LSLNESLESEIKTEATMGFFASLPEAGISARLARMERKLDAIIEQFEVQLPNDGFDEVRRLAAAGQKISAIKLYREMTGAGLAEAKSAVESGQL